MELRKLLEKDFNAGHVVFKTPTCYISSDDDANVGIKFKVAEPTIKKLDNIGEDIDVVSVEDPEQDVLSLKKIADVFDATIYEIEEGLYAMVALDTLLDVFAEVEPATLKDVLSANFDESKDPTYKDDKIVVVSGGEKSNFSIKFLKDDIDVQVIDTLDIPKDLEVRSLLTQDSNDLAKFYSCSVITALIMGADVKCCKLHDNAYCVLIDPPNNVPFIGDVFIVENKSNVKQNYLKLRKSMSQNA